MKKILDLMLITAMAIGIASCSKDANDGAGIPDQPIAATNDIDWSLFEPFGQEVINDLKRLVDGPETRVVGDLIMTVQPSASDVNPAGVTASVTMSKNSYDEWPAQVCVRIVQYPDMDEAIDFQIGQPNSGQDWNTTLTIPAFYSASANDSKIFIFQYSTDLINWRNPKIVLQKAMVGAFYTDLSDYEYSRIPAEGGDINVFRNQSMNENATFRIVSLDDGSKLANQVTIEAGSGFGFATLEVMKNPLDNTIIPFVIEYRLDNTPANQWIELGRGIQQAGDAFRVTNAKLESGSPWIVAVGEDRMLELVVENPVTNEINVRLIPHLHSGYSSPYELTATAYNDHPTESSLDGWKFEISFPAARGEAYPVGVESSGWHANFENDLKAGFYGAGYWTVEYEYSPGVWKPLTDILQKAYYIGVKNDMSMLRKASGDWIVMTQGYWPVGTVKFRATRIDNQSENVYTPEVIVNPTSQTTNSWRDALGIEIPANTLGYPIEWKFQYWIDEIGGWRTWTEYQIGGTPEVSWEGEGVQLVQYHF